MASTKTVRTAVSFGWVMVLFAPAMLALFAQRPSPAEGPWSGQAQCVVTAKGTDYLDEQTHTWRLTGEPPTPAARGSAQVYYTWPATWSVQGSGRKTFPPREPVAPGREPSERWTIASEMKMTLRITDVGSGTGRLRIGVESQRGAPLGAMRVTEVSGRTIDAAVQPWSFPAVEDSVSKTTISGTSTRTYPEGFGVGRGQPPKAITSATCTWEFVRGAQSPPQLSLGTTGRPGTPSVSPTETRPGGRGRGSPSLTAPPSLSRSIAMNGFTAQGLATAPRVIQMSGFIGVGSAVSTGTRAIVMTGFTGTGAVVVVPSRAIAMPGWIAVGQN